MIVSKQILSEISAINTDSVFCYTDFQLAKDNGGAVLKTLNRLTEKGVLKRVSKGKYYKPRTSVFGSLTPPVEEIVKDLLQKNGSLCGYLTGYSIYNQFGLTTQVSNIVQIASNIRKNNCKRGMYEIRFVQQKEKITKQNIYMLQLLDCLRFIREIPDTSVEQSIRVISQKLSDLSIKQRDAITKLSLSYPPATRALLGAITENKFEKELTEQLFDSLNPITVYNFTISQETLPNKTKWKIK